MWSKKLLVSVVGAAALLAACGGGGDGNQAPRVAITKVKVMGDSLSDSGTFDGLPAGSGFGRIFSVQGSASKIWPEITASAFGVNALCSFFKFNGTTFVANPTANCTNYAIGGGRINNALQTGGNASPMAVGTQLATAAAAGNHTASDLLLIDGGGNDAADLVTAYLTASADKGVAFATLLGTLSITPPASAAEFPAKGTAYMVALAQAFFNSIKTQALDKGATRVAVINLPAITLTPRFQAVLSGVEAAATATAGAAAGATARAQTEALIAGWIKAYNDALQTAFAGNRSVVIVDLNGTMYDQIANPAQYGLTNVKTPACPVTGKGSDGLPSYNFETCTSTALSALPNAANNPNWWTNYAFSDGFHPTPYAHKLLAQLVSRSLIAAGWL